MFCHVLIKTMRKRSISYGLEWGKSKKKKLIGIYLQKIIIFVALTHNGINGYEPFENTDS